jgi:hypothetical protein
VTHKSQGKANDFLFVEINNADCRGKFEEKRISYIIIFSRNSEYHASTTTACLPNLIGLKMAAPRSDDE